jgi:predicted O-methyltransferase YrrM
VQPAGDHLVPRASILARMRQVEGWLTDEEAELLIEAAVEVLRRFPPSHAIVEVGSYCGRSTVALASVVTVVAPNARVHAIDPHEGEVGAADAGTETTDPTFERFRENLARAGVSELVVPVRRRSYDVDWKRPIALLLLDGLHDYDNCARDFKHFESSLAQGSLVAFHDYESWPGVTAVVDELESTGAYERVKRAGSMVVLRRT